MNRRIKHKGEYVFALGAVPRFDIPEIKITYNRRNLKKWEEPITSSERAAKIIKSLFKAGEIDLQEQIIVLYMNNSNRVIGYHMHSKGGINASIADIRIILSVALKSLSVGIIIAHNHPSGNLKPSKEDINLTRKLKESASIMDITLLDHVIVTKEGHYSLADNGLAGVEDSVTKNKIIHGDVIEELKRLSSNSIDCVITSPPYWQLRDYGFKKQWGLERTYKEYLQKLWHMMDELYRVLKPRGTVWINLGDTYFGSGNGSGQDPTFVNNLRKSKGYLITPATPNTDKSNGIQKKCQMLIPHRFAIGCVDRGWIVRNDIIWAKPNGIPESIKDRFSKKHEYVFLLVKQADYYFDLDAVRDAHKQSTRDRVRYGMTAYGGDVKNKKGAFGKGQKNGGALKRVSLNSKGKNPGDVSDFWNISTKHGSSKHYATFNSELVTKPILAGCPEGGTVLDPFCGSGTTGVKAIELNRNFIGIDAKAEYCRLAEYAIKEAKASHPTSQNLVQLCQALKNLDFKNAA